MSRGRNIENVQGDYDRAETPLKGEEPPRNVYTSLLREYDVREPHPMKVLIHVREYMDNLYKHCAKVGKGAIVKRVPFDFDRIESQMAFIVGSWPAGIVIHQRRPKYVNPQHDDVRMFSPCVVKCECGTFVTVSRDEGKDITSPNIDNCDIHSEECRIEWKYKAWGELYEKRRNMIENRVLAGYSIRSCDKMLGVSSSDTASRIARTLGINGEELVERGRQRRVNTVLELLTIFSCEEIGKAFGVHKSTVRSWITKYTDYTPWEFNKFRRNH